MKNVYTKGNVLVNEIKIGDIHYEYDLGLSIECKVITKPIRDENGYWTWKSKNTKTNETVNYGVNEEYPHYAVNLYDYKAYNVKYYM